jgi:hypothetical protein
MTILSFCVAICIFGLSPGYLDDIAVYSHGDNTLNQGFMKAFGISDRLATILSLPALYGTTALFIYGYCKQLKSLSRSKLIPTPFSWTLPNSNIPYFNLLVVTTFNYALLIMIHTALSSADSNTGNIYLLYSFLVSYCFAMLLFFLFLGSFSSFIAALTIFYISFLGTFCTYFIMFISFITFRRNFSSLPRCFTNPFGIIGAISGMIVLFLSFIGFAASFYWNLPYFLIYILVLSLYYYLYARKTQTFSEEEQSILFAAYLIKGIYSFLLFNYSFLFLFRISISFFSVSCFSSLANQRKRRRLVKAAKRRIAVIATPSLTDAADSDSSKIHPNISNNRDNRSVMYTIKDSSKTPYEISRKSTDYEIPQFLPLFEERDEEQKDEEVDSNEDLELGKFNFKEIFNNISVDDYEDEDDENSHDSLSNV